MTLVVVGMFAGITLMLAIYCAVDPFKHSPIYENPNFQAFKVEITPWSEIPVEKDIENLLQKSEIKFLNEVRGPESLAFDPMGRGPYTGVADGRVIFWDGRKWADFAYTSANLSCHFLVYLHSNFAWPVSYFCRYLCTGPYGLCDPKPSIMNYLKNEHICGRPLGLRFDKRTGDLYIADAYFGLMKVGPEGGLAMLLATEAEGVRLGFTNDLDIDDEGNVYFTDSSTKYQRRNFLQLVYSGENSGRVLKYNPRTKETTVLFHNLQFPNGLSLSKDSSFFVFCEGAVGRLRKYWLKGEKAGTSEIMAVLPWFPDNIRTNEDGDFWVAIHCRRTMYAHILALYPKLRLFLLKLPIPAKLHSLTQLGGPPHAVVVKYSPEGKILKILEDNQGKVVKLLSQVQEKDGKLWIGSVLMPFVAVYKLD